MVLTCQLIRQYGLLQSFETICNMSGERVALITSSVDDNSQYDNTIQYVNEMNETDDEHTNNDAHIDDNDINEIQESIQSYEHDNDNDLNEDLNGVLYMELQHNAKQLAKQLYHRFGVKKEDRVLILCKDCRAAEIVALLACLYLKAIFVPIDHKWLCNNLRITDIINNCQPSVAIVVGDSDNDPVVLFLASLHHYKCSLLSQEGELIEGDTTMSNSSFVNDDDSDNASFSMIIDNTSITIDTDGDDVNQSLLQEQQCDLYRPIYILYTSGIILYLRSFIYIIIIIILYALNYMTYVLNFI